jgi:hypothetical protein
MPIVMAAAMYGTLLSAPDVGDLDVPNQLAARDWNHGRRVRRATCAEGERRACGLMCLELLLQKVIDTFPQRSQEHG